MSDVCIRAVHSRDSKAGAAKRARRRSRREPRSGCRRPATARALRCSRHTPCAIPSVFHTVLRPMLKKYTLMVHNEDHL